ncbi:hypothetical protein CRU98_10035 [Arcobacter sp. CECT 8986]|uniref:hypothetical protein n=1 Tax=Arcobacter sp. CECT 8986 TaxID=2044507 RepID=UPI001009A3AB|nr:hypothetical protein [Arcobacter sp. CECT 8986]RXJ98368.1 hypothetical protein CRU98_10035 [Arcobacter sp. CECT 8986]
MALFYVSLFQGRTDNLYLEMDNKNDVISFLETISTAKVVSIKKVVYSKKYLIGTTSGALAPSFKAHDKHLKVMVKTQNYTGLLDFRFPLKNISYELLKTNIKKYLTFNDEKIEDIINILKA